MNEQNREPLSDGELSALLKKWSVVAPPDLEARVMTAHGGHLAAAQTRRWWHFLLKGYIRVPVPVACCLAVLMIVVVWHSTKLAAACVASNSGVHAVAAVVAKTVPARIPASVGSCPANSKC